MFSMFAFDLLAMLAGSYTRGRLSSGHALRLTPVVARERKAHAKAAFAKVPVVSKRAPAGVKRAAVRRTRKK